MKSLHEIISGVRTIATYHPEINSFNVGPMEDIDIKQLGMSDYPLLYLEYGDLSLERGLATYSITLIIADLYNDQEGERTDTNIELLNPLHDVLDAFLQSYSSAADETGSTFQAHIDLRETSIQVPVTITPFWAEYDNHLTGWSVDLDVQVINDNSFCQALQE